MNIQTFEQLSSSLLGIFYFKSGQGQIWWMVCVSSLLAYIVLSWLYFVLRLAFVFST